MKCEFCDQQASVFFTQIVEGDVKHVRMCPSCAKEHGVTDPTGFSLADLLFGGPSSAAIAPAVATKSTTTTTTSASKTCPACGFTLEDLQRVRRMGCPECYPTFATEISQIIRGMHHGPTHQGKVPAGLMARQILHQRVKDLQTSLDEAIASEHYEEAAALRDQIRTLTDEAS